MVQGYIYILPSLFFMVCFCLLPIFMSTYFSFTDYDIMTKADFVGVDNYSKIFSDKYIIDALKNTAGFGWKLHRGFFSSTQSAEIAWIAGNGSNRESRSWIMRL